MKISDYFPTITSSKETIFLIAVPLIIFIFFFTKAEEPSESTVD